MRLYTLASIADIGAELDPGCGFILMATIVREINQMVARSLEKPDPNSGNDTAARHSDSDFVFVNALLQSKALRCLARADFEAALALAQSILPQQSSIAAQLSVCRGVLNGLAYERAGNSKKRSEEK